MDEEIDYLLGKLCTEMGFCLPPEEHTRIASSEEWKADEFAKEVIAAEGLNPEFEVRWFREIRNRFIKHFGSNVYQSKSHD